MAKLGADKRELLCVIRDVSEGGIRLRLFHELPQPTYLAIEMENGQSHALNWYGRRTRRSDARLSAMATCRNCCGPTGPGM